MLVIGHVSDLHLDGSKRATERAERVIAYLAELRGSLDAVLVTGDIADHGSVEEYAQADKLLSSLPYPVLTCPGNHDIRAAFREVLLAEPPNDAPINQLMQTAGAVFALCDSSIPGRDDGFLADETLTWLENALAEAPPETPVFIGFHHPPVLLHSPFIDNIRQRGAQRLAGLVARHPQVVALVCGHAHTAAAGTLADRPVRVAPAVASTLMLPWEAGPDLDFELPPMIAFHVLGDDGRLVTHYRVVPL